MTSCWICGRPIPPVAPQIIGTIIAGRRHVHHTECARLLGELELDLTRAEDAGRDSSGSGPA